MYLYACGSGSKYSRKAHSSNPSKLVNRHGRAGELLPPTKGPARRGIRQLCRVPRRAQGAWACTQDSEETPSRARARCGDPVNLDCQHVDQVEMQFRIRTTALLSAMAAGRCSCRCTAITTRCQVPHARSGRSCFKGSLANAIRPFILAPVPADASALLFG